MRPFALHCIALRCVALPQVPLRYGVATRGSRSAVWDRGDVALLQSAQGAPPQLAWYPLYTDGCAARSRDRPRLLLIGDADAFAHALLSSLPRLADRARFVQAVLLLNKNLERLLNAFGLPAVGPRHTAANLARLLAPALRPMPAPASAPDKGKHAAQGGAAQPQRGAS